MERGDADNKSTVPYVAFPTLITALDHLKSHGVPDKINSSVFPSFSGASVSHVLLTMRFLGLIDEKGIPQTPLAQLVDEKTRKQALAKIIPTAYAGLFQEVDIAKASPTSLDEAIKGQGMHGATGRKAKRFLIKATQFAGLPVSSHLLKRSRDSGAKKNGTVQRSSSRKAVDETNKPKYEPEQQNSKYSRVIELPEAGGTLVLSGDFDPFSLRGSEREFVYKIADLMAEFAAKGKVPSVK